MTPYALQGVEECPHCHRANPSLTKVSDRFKIELSPIGHSGYATPVAIFQCTTCLGPVLGVGKRTDYNTAGSAQIPLAEVYPKPEGISAVIPERPRQFLADAQGSLNAPSASVLASNSAIDAMLKEEGIGRRDEAGKERSLKARIDEAVAKNILTKGMSVWAHRVRLDANDQRHADDTVPLPTPDDARNTLRLAKAIAELLFVLPAEVPEEKSPTARGG